MNTYPLEDARVGYPCLYPHCKERRKYPIQLVEHVETDHTSREVLERMVIRDKSGNILALPPHCIYRYFPDVGLPPDKVHEMMESITGKNDRTNDPLLSSAHQAPTKYSVQPQQQQSTSSIFPGPYPIGDMAHSAVRFLANPPPATSSGPPVARIVPANITLNDLLTANGSASVTGNSQADKSQTSTFLNLLTLRQRMMLQASQQQLSSVGGENEEPNLVVAGLRQLLAAPHTPLLQQLVQSVSLEKHASLRGPGSVVSSSGSTALVAGRSDTLPLACISPAPSIGPVSGASCATPPAPSPDSGRGSESSMEESMDQVTSLPAAKGSSSSMLQSCLDENSNDSWMQREDYTVDSIVTYSRSAVGKRPKSTSDADKPYVCPVPGCLKAYKNMNGIKYHARCAHRIRKAHRCACNKKYSSEEKYLAHSVKCEAAGRKANEPPAPATTSPPNTSAQPANLISDICASASTTPTLHQLLSRSTSAISLPTNTLTTTMTSSLPSLPIIFGTATRTGGAASLLHTLLDG